MDIKGINIQKILDEMSLDEKLAMLVGKGGWNICGNEEIPSVKMSDGPHGIRMVSDLTDGGQFAAPATCFPTASALACSWDKQLAFEIGAALADEATALGVNVVLAPGVNIKRSPLCGRNFEYYSEDPLLSGEMGGAFIRGVQSQDVGACLKHFACNSQESYRMISDSIVDERALREIYLKPFEIAIKANPAMVMCAYNKVNSTYCSENSYLLTDILRDEWGYKGVTVSDWSATHNLVKAVRAGLDLTMPSDRDLFAYDLEREIADGSLSMETINKSVRRLIELTDNVYLEPSGSIDYEAHDNLAYKAAVSSAVLLKNDGILPITPDKSIALIGKYATNPVYQGGGSSQVNPPRVASALDAFTEIERGVEVISGYGAESEILNDELRSAAVVASASADVCLVFLACADEAEGYDRNGLRLPSDQDKLMEALISAGRKVVAVLNTGGAIEMPWALRVNAILQVGLAGQQSALAAVDILTGRANPQGRLSETYPQRYRDCILSSYYGKDPVADYRESIFVGYRYFDKVGMQVLFPFGYGLSYSDIRYTKMTVKRLGEYDFTVSVSLKNVSPRGAFEVVQLYVSDINGFVPRPLRELKGFCKVYVDADSTVTVDIPLSYESFSFYDAEREKWSVFAGTYEISVGSSSRDLPLRQSIVLEEGNAILPNSRPPERYYKVEGSFTLEEFESLIGRKVNFYKPPVKGEFTTYSTSKEISSTFAGKQIVKMLKKRATVDGKLDSRQLEQMLNMPLDALMFFGGDAFTPVMLRAIVDLANGKTIKGISGLLNRKSDIKKIKRKEYDKQLKARKN